MRNFFLFVLITMLFSCKKEDSPVVKTFDIVEIPIDSNRVVTSIDTIVNHPSGCGTVPSPSDSLDVDSLDLNYDGTYDSYISAKSWYQFVSASYPCANYSHSIVLAGTLNEIQFSKTGMYNQVKVFDENELIDSTQEWMGSVMFNLYVPNAPFSCSYQGEHYVGYRFLKNGGFQYGWLKVRSANYGVRITKVALNKTVEMGMPAGKYTN